MTTNLKKTSGIYLTIFSLISITPFQSCKNQEEKAAYNPKAIELNDKAIQLMQRTEYDSALALFNKAIAIDSNYYLPYANMTGIFLTRKQFDKALQASDKVVEIKPDYAEGWILAGMLYDSQGDSLTALKYYKKGIGIFDNLINDPEKSKDLNANKLNRAVALILSGQDKEGKDELRKLKAGSLDNAVLDEFLKLDKEGYIEKIIYGGGKGKTN